MDKGHFYFVKDQFFIDFPDKYLSINKNTVNCDKYSRQCFYAIKDKLNNIYWLIPISSKANKYKEYYKKKISKYGRCDTLAFGEVLGYEKAFLIQNMFPISDSYINNEYLDKNNKPVRINSILEKEIISKANKVLALERHGKHLLYTDGINIEEKLKIIKPK